MQKTINVCKKIEGIRYEKGIPAFKKRENITALMIQDLKKQGSFFKTPQDQYYFREGDLPKLFPIEKDSIALSAFISDQYRLNKAERKEYEHLLEGMRNEAFLRGKQVEVHRLAHFDRKGIALYVSNFNGCVYKLNGETIETVHNGTDGVFFLEKPSWQPFKPVRVSPTSNLLRDLIVGSANFTEADGLTVRHQQWIFQKWLLGQFFPSLNPTKPLLLMCGPKGGGKTLALRKWLKLLFGDVADVTGIEKAKPDGFVATVTSEPVAAFDNVDDRISWLPDHLAQLATGVVFIRRKLFTTNEEASYPGCCWVAMTSRTPSFIDGRDDVLDRTLILRTERFPQDDYRGESMLLERVRSCRNRLWSELLRDLNKIVAYIREHGDDMGKVQFRMADFGNFLKLVAAAEGGENMATEVMNRMQKRQCDMLLTEEPIAVCLGKWLEEPLNHGRKVYSSDLQKELTAIAPSLPIPWPYNSPSSLGQRLSHISTNLGQRFKIESDTDSANQRWYRFWPLETLTRAEFPDSETQAA